LVTVCLHYSANDAWLMPMEPNRTRQVLQDLARTFNKLASELTADLSYAAREIESLRKEVQRLRSSPGKTSKTNGNSKKSSSRAAKTGSTSHRTSTSHKTSSPSLGNGPDSEKPAHEPGSFVFPQEPFSPSPPPEPSPVGNN
jgi:hypothetical protein